MEKFMLEKINCPSSLKNFSQKEIDLLCADIRSFLIESVEKNGGHLASNLGITEVTVAIHRVFDSPTDHIIFDVGHQSYVHKILTGRKDEFDTLRKTGGLSGFTKMSESEHDAFGAGHSSTSISAALGYAEADRLRGSDAYTVVVLGDGAYTGGMVHEALNNIDPALKLIVILNENGMSISVNKGAFARYLTGVRMSKGYQGWKEGTKSVLSHIPLIGKPLTSLLTFLKQKIKALFFSSNYFEDLGLYYIGPIDGNNYTKVEKTLKKAKNLGKSVVVHVKTVKGKGYVPAERAPEGYHSVTDKINTESSFHSVAAQSVIDIAGDDESVVAVTPAMGMGTGFDKFGEIYPDRYFDVGIAEEHAVTFSAGLAAAKMKPFAAIYSTFLQRAYDSVLHDAALQNLSVRLMIDRAGLSVRDGATHHGIFDVAFLSHIPNVTVISPATYSALRAAVKYALSHEGVIAVRYPNRAESEAIVNAFYKDFSGELSLKATFSPEAAPEKIYVTYGTVAEKVLAAMDMLIEENLGAVLLEVLKPYDLIAKQAIPYLRCAKKIVFVEEGIKNGGAAMLFHEALENVGYDFSKCKYEILAIDDNFASPNEPCDLYDFVGLSPEKIAEKMK